MADPNNPNPEFKFCYPDDFNGTFWTIIDADFYVSTIGNDITGDGSPKKPFLTIHRAFEEAVDGDKIIIGPDEYLRVDAVSTGENAGTELPCRLASTQHISLLSEGLFTIDGVITTAGDRVLLWNQNDPTENGIYIASANAWERADDFNNPDNITPGKLIPILEGAQNTQTIFQFITNETIVVGTTGLNFTQAAVSDWGQIQGNITEQDDLSLALDSKADDSELAAHATDTSNPHVVTKAQVGLEKVNNTTDQEKPVSDAQQIALDLKLNNADVIDNLLSIDGSKALSAKQGQILNGFIVNINALLASNDTDLDQLQEIVNFIKQNKTDLDALGISNIAGLVDALNDKADNSVVNAHILDTNNPHNVDKTQLGLANVDDTSDEDKPISTTQQNVLDTKAEIVGTPENDQIGVWTGDGTIEGGNQFKYDALNNQLNVARNSVLPSGIRDSIFQGDNHNISVGTDRGWSVVLGEKMAVSTPGLFNNTLMMGFDNSINSSTNIFATTVLGVKNRLDGSFMSRINVLGHENKVGDPVLLPSIFQSSVIGTYGHANGSNTTVIGNNVGGATVLRVSEGIGAINAGSASPAQTVGHGTIGEASGIFAGVDGNVPSDSPRSVVIGGNTIKADAATPDTVFLPKVRIGKGTGATIPTGTNENLLVLDGVSGEVNQVTQNSVLNLQKVLDNNSVAGGLSSIVSIDTVNMPQGDNILFQSVNLSNYGKSAIIAKKSNKFSVQLEASSTDGNLANLTVENGAVTLTGTNNTPNDDRSIISSNPLTGPSMQFNNSFGIVRTILDDANSILFIDTLNSKGASYAADYADNFSERSLVDKGYVDNQVQGFVDQTYVDNQIQASVVNVTDNLTSISATDALSANQGKLLKDLVDGLVTLSRTVATFTDLPGDAADQENIFVQDATGDPTVDSGWAIYKSISGAYVKISEQESLDLVQFTDGNGTTINGNSVDLGGSFDNNTISLLNTSGVTDANGGFVIDIDGEGYGLGNGIIGAPSFLRQYSYSKSTAAGEFNYRQYMASGEGEAVIVLEALSDATVVPSIGNSNLLQANSGFGMKLDSQDGITLLEKGASGLTKRGLSISNSNGIVLTDEISLNGATYAADYSQNFVDRSLVDKGYVDAAVGGTGGDVNKVGTPANNQIAVWTGDGTIEGNDFLTFEGGDFVISGGIGLRCDLGKIRTGSGLGIGVTPTGAIPHPLSVFGSGDATLKPTTNGSTAALFSRIGGVSDSSIVNIMSGNAAISSLYFGDTDLESAGSISYNHSNDSMVLSTNNVSVLSISSIGVFDFIGNNLKNIEVVEAISLNIESSGATRGELIYNVPDGSFNINSYAGADINITPSGDIKLETSNAGKSISMVGSSSSINTSLNDVSSSIAKVIEDINPISNADVNYTFKIKGADAYFIDKDGNWDFQANRLKNIAAPTDPDDVATMAYVDANSGGGATSNGVNQIVQLSDGSGGLIGVNSNKTALFQYVDSGTTNIPNIVDFNHVTSGTPANNFGVAAQFRLNTAFPGKIIYEFDDVTGTSEDTNFKFQVHSNGSIIDVLQAGGTGLISSGDWDYLGHQLRNINGVFFSRESPIGTEGMLRFLDDQNVFQLEPGGGNVLRFLGNEDDGIAFLGNNSGCAFTGNNTISSTDQFDFNVFSRGNLNIRFNFKIDGTKVYDIDQNGNWDFQENDLTNIGSIQSSGHVSYQTGIEAKAGNYIMTNADNGKILQVTGNRTISVPASGVSAGWTIMIVNEGAGTVTINSNGQTINSKGAADPLLANQWGGCTIYFDGTNFTAIGDLS